ncbi:MAG: T9SS type A sorting domain-containing protein [Bacteroidales bacterium]|nr:T9SS type A sorting domain-containing protein [Bacteroidales bacterium]
MIGLMDAKRIFLSVLTLCFVSFLSAQTVIPYAKHFDTIRTDKIQIKNKEFYSLNFGEDMPHTKRTGYPKLPQYTEFITVPVCDSIVISDIVLIKDTVYLDKNIPVEPAQKSLLKIVDDTAFYFDKAGYLYDGFNKSDYVSIKQTGSMGGYNTALLVINPVRYNPVKGIIETISEISFNISFVNQDATATAENIACTSQSVSSFVRQKSSGASTLDMKTTHPYKMVIVSDESFKQVLQPFVEFKQRQGFKIIQAYTSQTGKTKEEIYSYLKNLYFNATPADPAFDYLLIAGDTSVVPAFTGKYRVDNYPVHYTDLYYAEYTDDILPDVFYGRMSATDTLTLKNIIDKTIIYESYAFKSGDDFLKNSLLIAGKETGSNAPTMTNGQMNYAKNYLAGYTDTTVFYNPESASTASKQSIRSALNAGNSWVNYTGHCISQGWQIPVYYTADADTSLSNINKFGVFINNCCLAGKFDDSICFTESLLQAKDKGAAGAIGASDYTLWEEDYYWSVGNKSISVQPVYASGKNGMYDALFHSHGEPVNEWYTTLGQMFVAGNLAVMQNMSDYSDYYWEVYNLQGDPSLVPYTGKPLEMNVTLPEKIVLGEDSLCLSVPPYTYAALSRHDSLINVALADSLGHMVLDISRIVDTGKVCIMMTNQFYAPKTDYIQFVSPDTAFVALKNLRIIDAKTSQCADILVQGRTYRAEFEVVNSGKHLLKTDDNFIKFFSEKNLLFSEKNFFFSEKDFGKTISEENAFTFSVSEDVKDMDEVAMQFIIYVEGKCHRVQTERMLAASPQPCISSLSLARTLDGFKLGAVIMNVGRSETKEGLLTIDGFLDSDYVQENQKQVKKLGFRQKDTVFFDIIHSDNASKLVFNLTYEAGNQYIEKPYDIELNALSCDFENGLDTLMWDNGGEYPWTEDSSVSFSGNKSFRSSKKLTHGKKSRLYLKVNNSVSCNVSFFVKVSSEENYDRFRFFVDGKEYFSLSGEQSWVQKTTDISSGEHVLCFAYDKDYDISLGHDAAWIDRIALYAYSDSIVFSTEDLTGQSTVIFPNPSHGEVHIDALLQNSVIYIYDIAGRLVYVKHSELQGGVLDVSFLKSGTYNMVIKTSDNKIITEKLIIAG